MNYQEKTMNCEEKRNAVIDKIQELYKFPVALINMYDMKILTENNWLTFKDGISFTILKMDDFQMTELTDKWSFQKGTITIELFKETRTINTFIL